MDTVLAIYSVAGLLELGGVSVTAIDVWRKSKALREFRRPAPRPGHPVEAMRQNTAAAEGLATLGQLSRVGLPIGAALSGRTLAVAAALLMAGVILGTIGNALSATR